MDLELLFYENKIVVIAAQDVQHPASEPGWRIGRVDNFIEVKK